MHTSEKIYTTSSTKFLIMHLRHISYCPEYEIDIDGIKQNALCFTKHLYWMHVAHILRQNDRKMIQTFPIYSISLFFQNRFIITPCLDR